jgi:hypothetical protein
VNQLEGIERKWARRCSGSHRCLVKWNRIIEESSISHFFTVEFFDLVGSEPLDFGQILNLAASKTRKQEQALVKRNQELFSDGPFRIYCENADI